MEYYLAIKKNEMVPFVAAWMGLDITILSEVSQMEKDKYMISLICILNGYKLTYFENRNRLTDCENEQMVTRRRELESGRTDWECEIDMHSWLYLK